MRGDEPTALVVPAPSVDAALGGFRSRFDSSAGSGMPAHLTVLYPFVRRSRVTADLLDALAELSSAVASFEFALTGVGQFPDVVYLRPDPPEPFVALTRAVHERWPAHPPYEGRFDTVVPHVTVADDPRALGHLAEIEAALPLGERAAEVLLMGRGARGRWRVLHRVPLTG